MRLFGINFEAMGEKVNIKKSFRRYCQIVSKSSGVLNDVNLLYTYVRRYCTYRRNRIGKRWYCWLMGECFSFFRKLVFLLVKLFLRISYEVVYFFISNWRRRREWKKKSWDLVWLLGKLGSTFCNIHLNIDRQNDLVNLTVRIAMHFKTWLIWNLDLVIGNIKNELWQTLAVGWKWFSNRRTSELLRAEQKSTTYVL